MSPTERDYQRHDEIKAELIAKMFNQLIDASKEYLTDGRRYISFDTVTELKAVTAAFLANERVKDLTLPATGVSDKILKEVVVSFDGQVVFRNGFKDLDDRFKHPEVLEQAARRRQAEESAGTLTVTQLREQVKQLQDQVDSLKKTIDGIPNAVKQAIEEYTRPVSG
jgi:hypothetical protein